MAVHKSTINSAPGYNSSVAKSILWSSFDSGANNLYFDVKSVNATKMVILVAGHSTLENVIWIGTSDSRSSQTSKSYPYSLSKLGPLKILSTGVSTDGDPASKFRSTVVADSEVWKIMLLGPFETARFADSNGYIKVCRGKVTVGKASHSSNEQQIAAILLP